MELPPKSQIDKLGERLRVSETVSDADLEMLQAVREAYDDALAVLTERLAALEIDGEPLRPTSRLKTIGTIIDKLRRESRMRLTQMDDVAGTRLVIAGSRIKQDRVVRAVLDAFPGGTVKDRRGHPSFGYRAVHVIVEQDGRRVEIQVRTPLQDLWAQVVERIAESWGRGIRYGEPAEAVDEEFQFGMTRGEVVSMLMELSDQIDLAERNQSEVEELRGVALPDPARQRLQETAELVDEFMRSIAELLRPFTGFDF